MKKNSLKNKIVAVALSAAMLLGACGSAGSSSAKNGSASSESSSSAKQESSSSSVNESSSSVNESPSSSANANSPAEKFNSSGMLYAAQNSYTEYLSVADRYYQKLDEEKQKKIQEFVANTTAKYYAKEWEGNNFLYSPVSLYLALCLAEDLADENVTKDLLSLLGTESLADMESTAQTITKGISSETDDDAKPAICKVSNSIWSDDSMALDDKAKKVLDNASEKFFADLFNADLQSKETIDAMNSWVSAKTEGLIKEIPFEPGDGTKMLLFNALYFKKKWDDPIDKALTAKEDFTLASGEKIQVDMMKAEVAYYKESNMKYYRTENTLSAPYYYSDGSYCIFVRPEKVCGREDMKNIISDELPDIIDAFINWRTKETGSLKLSIPKLSYETKTEHMQDELIELGVNSVFDSAAEPFSPLGGGLAITEIAQKCKIIMDEEGTEAAAVTEIAMDEGAPAYEEPNIELNLDQPYAYVIMSSNNIPLFVGVVENPAAE
ncbi:MAG: hypothetical protein IKR27_09590 [Lachnospiraceae bacterium]|nr:hypothetical protein [Lachnospiraceae bacterium]